MDILEQRIKPYVSNMTILKAKKLKIDKVIDIHIS